MIDYDFRCLVAKYFTTLEQWRTCRTEEKKRKCKRFEVSIREETDRYFKRIEANKQRTLKF